MRHNEARVNESLTPRATIGEILNQWDDRVSCLTPDPSQTILLDATCNISTRAAERDVQAERSMKRTVAIFNAYAGLNLTETEGWMFMVALKMARAKGGKFQRDDYVDMASYCGLAGECAEQEERGDGLCLKG